MENSKVTQTVLAREKVTKINDKSFKSITKVLKQNKM